MTRHHWTPRECQTLRERYPHERTADLAQDMGMAVSKVYNKAHGMGLKKSAAFFASDNAGRIQRGRSHPSMIASQFKPGHQTWNKGQKFDAGGRSHETQFKKDRPPSAARNYRPIGSTRISKDGYLERKMNDRRDIYSARRWTPVHRLVWEAKHGPIPDGHIITFKPGQFTNTEADITIDRLECLSRAEHMQRHTYHNYPKPIAQLIQLRGALNRRINNATKTEETA